MGYHANVRVLDSILSRVVLVQMGWMSLFEFVEQMGWVN
jgi:hypothetical protein